jgi:hypothetical protein
MEHVVFYTGPDGSQAHRRLPSQEDAVRFVEHLRNEDGVADVSVFELTEVELSFRPYYRVEVGRTPRRAAHRAPEVAEFAVPAQPATDGEVPSGPPAEAEQPVAGSRRGLGFFAH